MKRLDDLVTVIVPAYNAGEYIEECISGICDQTYQNLEIIIVDDGSTDDTYDRCTVMASGDARIKLLRQENSGVVSARQKGLETAGGKYVSFVDSDDLIDRDMIEIFVSSIEGCDLVSAGVIWEESKGNLVKRRDLFPVGLYEKSALEELYRSMIYDTEIGMSHNISPWMVNKLFVTENALEIHSTMDTSLRMYEDAAFVYKYLLNCKSIRLIEEYPYHYRFNGQSVSHKKNNNILEQVSRSYTHMLDSFEGEEPSYRLKEQLQTWFMEKCYFAINERMDVPADSRVIRYLLNTEGIEGRKLILYGAGRVGLDVRFQLKTLGIPVALWVDKRYLVCRKEGLYVDSPEMISGCDHDEILIAVENPKVQESIRRDLIEMGIDEKEIRTADIRRLF